MIAHLDIGVMLTIATIVFSAGILYNKVSQVEKKVNKIDEHGERITAVETDIKILKQHTQ